MVTPWHLQKLFYVITARKRSLGQGNIFTPVCHSVHGGGGGGVRGWKACVAGGGMCGQGGRHAWLGGVCGRGHAWPGGAWPGGNMHGWGGACVVGGWCVAGGCAWLGGMCGWGACMAGGMHGGGMRGMHPLPPADTTSTAYGQPSGGTHPTGMHSCFKLITFPQTETLGANELAYF